MIREKAFDRLLGLDECWEVANAEYETGPAERFVLFVRETDKLLPKLKCTDPKSGCEKVVCHDHTEPRVWRHLDAFERGPRLCARRRERGARSVGRCGGCRCHGREKASTSRGTSKRLR